VWLLVALFFVLIENYYFICAMEFYIRKKGDKHTLQRVYFEDVVMVSIWVNGLAIHLAGKPYLFIDGTIETVYDLFFRKNKSFIRASAHYIVNTNHIVSAELLPDNVKLTLTDNKTAVLRNGHDYAYFIQHNRYKDEKKNPPIDSEAKDLIIIKEGADVNSIIAEIKETTGEVVNRRYIVRRYRELKSEM
jgi:hypothetical protein